MSEVIGVVTAVSNKYGKFSVLVNDVWYGTKEEWAPSPKPQSGDEISFDDKGGKFLNKVKILSKSTTSKSDFLQPKLSRDRLILRQNALTNAVNYFKDVEHFTVDKVIDVARQFEAYTSGDSDILKVEKELDS